MALQLTWSKGQPPEEPRLRCSKCVHLSEAEGWEPDGEHPLMHERLFHPISEMHLFEDLDTGLIQYCCQW